MKRINVKKAVMSIGMAVMVVAMGCSVQYRHEVEEPGTAAQYQYGAGGFIRYDGYGEVAGDMQIASVDFKKPGSEITIRLTGVIHIGDIEYYKTLQREALDTADVVLFEGVQFEGDEDELKKAKANAPDLGKLYSTMGELLGIGFQKDGIDYTSENFVHCDVTVKPDDPLNQQVDPGQMAQAIQMLGPILTMKRMLTQGPDGQRTEDAMKHQMVNVMLQQMGGIDDEEMFKKLQKQDKTLPPGMAERAKKAAEALKGTPILPGGFGGMSPEMEEQILHRRNDYVVDALKARLAGEDPSEAQTIAIFYGAAHNPGIAASLTEMGYEPVKTVWFRAWNMNSREKGYVVKEHGDHPVVTPSAKGRPKAKKEKREPVLF